MAILCMTVTACSSCVTGGMEYNANWPKTNDANAKFARVLLDQTVRVDVKMIIDISPITSLMSGGDNSNTIVEKGSGSGTVVAKKIRDGKVESLVLTANHVCHVPKYAHMPSLFPVPLNVIGVELSTVNSSGDVMKASIIYEDESYDLCVIKVMGNVGNVASIASEMPPVGARITHAGAPTGTYGRHLGVVVDGRYAGIENINGNSVVAMALPIEPGSSGGGMYYNGSLFATLNWSSGRGGNMSWGASLEHVKDSLNKANIIWMTSN